MCGACTVLHFRRVSMAFWIPKLSVEGFLAWLEEAGGVEGATGMVFANCGVALCCCGYGAEAVG